MEQVSWYKSSNNNGLHALDILIKLERLDYCLLREAIRHGNTSHTVSKFNEVELLFIDDFGVDRSSERAERDYYELIDNRWENMRPMLITTNLTLEFIEEKYGSRIFSRLKDSKWISFIGLPDLRGENQCR